MYTEWEISVPTFQEQLWQESDWYTNEYKVSDGKKVKLVYTMGIKVNNCGSELTENALQ